MDPIGSSVHRLYRYCSMKFLFQVQKEKIPGPLRRAFDRSRWDAAFAALGEEAEDRAVHDAGLLIYQKADEVRKLVRFAFSDVHSATTKVRAIVAMSNRFVVDIERRTIESLNDKGKTVVTVFDILTLKLGLPIGAEFSPDEILQSIVDGAQIPLRASLEKAASLEGVPKFAAVNWDEVWTDIHLGMLYGHLEGLWDDCLWNGYQPIQSPGDVIRFTPREPEWSRRLTASQLRFNNLAGGFLGIITNAMFGQELPGLAKVAAVRKVKAIRNDIQGQTIVFVPSDAKDGNNEEAALVRLYVSETAFPELLSEAQGYLEGATLDHLLNAWIIVRQVGERLRDPLRSFEEKNRPAHTWIPQFAPLIHRNAIVRALKNELALNEAQARALVDFLTYRGKATQELWAQPLVPVSTQALAPAFGALTAEPTRLVDVWLRQLGVNLTRRGPAFERHVRNRLTEFIDASQLKSQTTLLPDAFVFRPPGAREEEMDLILCVGDTVVIGEIKCVLRPTEAKGIAEHRNVLISGAAQVARKVAAAKAYASIFRQQLIAVGMPIPDSFRIIPMVVTNTAIHVGFPVNGVPIADLHVLEVFFIGYYSDTLMESGQGTRDVRRHRVYATSAEAAQSLDSYLARPPQMATYTGGLRERWIPISSVGDADTPWLIRIYESVPDTSAVLAAIEGRVDTRGGEGGE